MHLVSCAAEIKWLRTHPRISKKAKFYPTLDYSGYPLDLSPQHHSRQRIELHKVWINLQTQVFYGRYADFGEHKYPSTITIKRPMDGLQLVLTVEKVTENLDLKNESFQLQIPPDTKVKKLP